MRTKNSILNFSTSFFPWLFLAILGFFKINFFINSYGSELNGLVQLAHQVFSFLTIASAGFTSAVIFHLYEPLIKKDHKKINALLSGSKKSFKLIGIFIFICGVIASLIIPYIIYQSNIPNIFVFLLFFLYALDYLSSYLLMLPYRVILEADQKLYIVNVLLNGKQIIFRVLELYLITIKFNILLILLIGVIANLFVNILIAKKTKNIYSWLNLSAVPDKSPLKMTKDVLYHRVLNFVFHNCTIILLSIFKGLTAVSVYGAYNYIMQYLVRLINFVYEAPRASIANYFKSNKNKNKEKLLNEYFTVTFILSLIIIPTFVISIGEFIKLWINDTYVLNKIVILLFGGVLWGNIITFSLFSLIEANGLFKETKKTATIASIINVIMSIVFVYYYGISGALLAIILGNILLHIFYSKKIYASVVNNKTTSFYNKYVLNIIFIIVLLIINNSISQSVSVNNLFLWFIKYGLIFILNILISILLNFIFDKNTKSIYKRIIIFIKKTQRKELKNEK